MKIDPESIGVGQYQHDLPAKALASEVDAVVERAVNQVGVNLNTASYQLLTHISGLSKTIATNIVKYRDENGRYNSRAELKKYHGWDRNHLNSQLVFCESSAVSSHLITPIFTRKVTPLPKRFWLRRGYPRLI